MEKKSKRYMFIFILTTIIVTLVIRVVVTLVLIQFT
jgi:hypothetical protein